VIRLVLARLVAAIVVLFVVASLGFLALRLAKGGPFAAEKQLSPQVRANVEKSLGLREPLGRQYLTYLKGLARGDFGWSMKRPGVKVSEIIAENFPQSLQLGLLALLFAVAFGVVLGVTAASRGPAADRIAMTTALVGISIPSFVLGPILIHVFSLKLGWLPPARWDGLSSMILPAVTLGMVFVGTIARLTRAGMLETIRQDFVRTARAKGLTETQVVWKHALRLGIIPVVSYLAPAIAYLVTGSIVIETIFQIPGLGFYVIGSVQDHDYTTLAGVMVFYCAFVLALNLLVDIAYGFLDPRVREGR
jgi:oligopeptide transport system permease protein